MATISTPYMNLALPIPTVELGPAWAFDLNAALGLIDSHTHLPGQGQPVPTAGININADLSMNHFNLNLTRSSRYDNQVSPLALPADINNIYVSGGNLWYNNSIGQQVQITSGSSINVAGTGTIGGDYGMPGVPAVVDYFIAPANTYYFFQDVNTYAPIATGPITISGVTANANGVTISVPGGLAFPYSLTLPSALPLVTNFVTIDSSGNVAATANVDGTTLAFAAQTLSVADMGITQQKLAPRATGQTVAAGGVALSPTQTTNPQSTTNTSNTDIDGVNVTITTTGRPVFVGWVAGTGTSLVQVIGPDSGLLGIIRDSVTSVTSQQYNAPEPGIASLFGTGAIWGIDYPAAGTYTYKAIFHVTNGSTQVTTTNLALVAYEL